MRRTIIAIVAVVVAVVLVGLFNGELAVKDRQAVFSTIEEEARYIRENGHKINDAYFEVSFSTGESWDICRRTVEWDDQAYVIEWDQNDRILTFHSSVAEP